MSASQVNEFDVEKWLDPVIKAFDEEEAAESHCVIHVVKLRKVSDTLSQNEVNADCFVVPRIVTIGPIYHHGRYDLGPAGEVLKQSVAEQYAARYLKHKLPLLQVHKRVKESLLTALKCYDYRFYSDDDTLSWKMLIDGLFLLAFMDSELNGTNIRMRKHDRDLVCRDILLLENQIPFTVLRLLARIVHNMTTDDTVGFIKRFLSLLIASPFKRQTNIRGFTFISILYYCCPRFYYYISNRYCWESFIVFSPKPVTWSPNNLLELLRETHFATSDCIDQRSATDNVEFILAFPSATELKKVGIHCVSGATSNYLSDVRFVPYWLSGELVLPLLTINEWTKVMFLNLIALSNYDEEEEDRGGAWISSYLWIMHKLIVKADDVKELQTKGILQNYLADDQAVVDMFREIASDVVPDLPPFMKLRRKISTYLASRKLPLRIVFAEFKERYFSSPWSVLVFLAIIFTVSLTVIQTVFAAMQVYLAAHPPKN